MNTAKGSFSMVCSDRKIDLLLLSKYTMITENKLSSTFAANVPPLLSIVIPFLIMWPKQACHNRVRSSEVEGVVTAT